MKKSTASSLSAINQLNQSDPSSRAANIHYYKNEYETKNIKVSKFLLVGWWFLYLNLPHEWQIIDRLFCNLFVALLQLKLQSQKCLKLSSAFPPGPSVGLSDRLSLFLYLKLLSLCSTFHTHIFLSSSSYLPSYLPTN